MDTPTPIRARVTANPPKAKPDARPMRLALGAGGLAALSALATAIVLPPRTAIQVQQPQVASDQQSQPQPADTPPTDPTAQASRPVVYVQLAPGQTAPPGATVIQSTASVPAAVVVTGPAPVKKPAGGGNPPAANPPAANPPAPPAAATPAPPPPPKPTPIVIKTTQSGKVVP